MISQVDESWGRAWLSTGLPFRVVSNPDFRKALSLTARCGPAYLTHERAGKYDSLLPNRTTFTTKTVANAEAKLNEEIEMRMKPLIKSYGSTILSDGWTSIQNRPIINVLVATRGHSQLKMAIDTSGNDKTMEFIFDKIDQVIKEVGPENVFAVCMDGACKGAFDLIKGKYKWIQCFVCPSHGLDGFLKNACSDKETIRMQANKMGGIGTQMMEWDVSFFHDIFDDAWSIIKKVVRHHKPLALFRAIAKDLPKDTPQDKLPKGGTEPKKFGETRYGSRVIMAERMLDTRIIYRKLFVNTEFEDWIKTQARKKRDKVGHSLNPFELIYYSIFAKTDSCHCFFAAV